MDSEKCFIYVCPVLFTVPNVYEGGRKDERREAIDFSEKMC